jgi:hypothetical protein
LTAIFEFHEPTAVEHKSIFKKFIIERIELEQRDYGLWRELFSGKNRDGQVNIINFKSEFFLIFLLLLQKICDY